MTKRPLEKTTKSRAALQAFYGDIESKYVKANVEAYVNDNLVYDDTNVGIGLSEALAENNGIGRINIEWEKDGKLNFRALGLYGYYDVNYNVDIEYENGILSILTDTSSISVYIPSE